jgi:regulatory protein
MTHDRPPRRTPNQRREARAQVEDPEVVMDAAATFLAVRPRSIAETRRRLRHLGYRHGLIDSVIERLLRMGYLDDDAFARAWVESRDRARPRGEMALRRELLMRGVAAERIATVLGERAANAPSDTAADLAAARRLLERRGAALNREAEPRKRRQKAYALLARNGFSPEIASRASAEIAAAAGDLEED